MQNYESPKIDSPVYLPKAEFVRSGFGVFSLVTHRNNPSSSFFTFELDGFQSCCQRDWLSFRWRATEMQGAVIRMLPTRRLLIWKDLSCFGGYRADLASLSVWADQIIGRMEEIKQSRT